MKTRQVHELKCWTAQFAAIQRGDKRFEIRNNDREFAVGDEVILSEFDPDTEIFSGRAERRMITFLLSEEDMGVIHGYVAIGFGPMPGAVETVPGGESLSLDDLAAWHAREADNAALRAQNAQLSADGYRRATEGRQAVAVHASRQDAVAGLAAVEARFHAAAAALVQGRA